MRLLFLDIENTVIDDLVNCNFLEDNCEKISRLIKEIDPAGITFFTWGWKLHSDIDNGIIQKIYDKLDVPEVKRADEGNLLVKEDSVNFAIEEGWLNESDFPRAIEPGMMGEFGISKPSCFIGVIPASVTEKQLKDFNATVKDPIEFWLVDDIVDEKEEIEWHDGKLKAVVLNPKDLD